MMAALNPRRVSNDELVYGNLISSCRASMPFDWLDRRWQLRLSRTPGEPGQRYVVEADWGGARLIVSTPLAWVDLVSQAMLLDEEPAGPGAAHQEAGQDGAPQLAELPELLRLAVIEAAFARASAQIEQATRKRFRIVASGARTPDPGGLESLGWTCESGAQQLAGELHVDAQGLAFLGTALRSFAGSLGDLDEWASLPVPLRFAVGWVDLPTRTLADVGPRDVIVLDESWLRPWPAGASGTAAATPGDAAAGEAYAITVMVGKTSAFRAQLKGSTITVTAGLGDIMADMAQAEMSDEEGTLNDVTIRLTFDLGERSVTIAELRSLAPGFCFDLGRELRRSVTIRANGVAVGEGELVDIDGRIGVSVLTLNRFAD